MPIQLGLGADLDFVCRSTRVTSEDRKIEERTSHTSVKTKGGIPVQAS